MNLHLKSTTQTVAQCLAGLLSFILLAGAHAASLTWGPAGGGGAGTWDASITANWYDGGGAVVWPNTGGEDAVFAGTGATVTNDAGVYVQNMTFNTTGYTVGTNVLNLSGSTPTITVGSGLSATISAPLDGYAGLTKAGAGTLTLSGANTFTGGTTINPSSGILIGSVHTNRSAISSGAVSVGAGATLQLNNLNTVNVTPIIGNAFTGSGLLRLNFAAGTTARNTSMTNVTGFTGTIELANAGSTGDKWNAGAYNLSGVALQINSGSQLFHGAVGTLTFGSISVTGTGNSENRGAIRVGSGSAILAAPITLLGHTSVGLEAVGATISGNISGTAVAGTNQVLTVGTTSSTGSGTLSGLLSDGTVGGKLALTKANTGILTLTGNNTYSGPTTITGGKLVGVPGGSCSNSIVTVNNTAGYSLSVQVTDNTRQWACGGLTLPGTNGVLEFDFGTNTVPSTVLAPLLVNGNVAFTNANLLVKAGALPVTAGSYPLMTWTGTASGTIPTTATLPAHVVGNLTLSGDGKTLILNVTRNNQQPLTWNAATASAAWDIGISANWKDATGASGQYYLQTAVGGDSVVFDDSLAPAGPLTVTVPATVSPANMAVNNATKNYTITGAAISGSTGLTKSGAGSLMLVAANSYTGPTVINGGTVIVSNNTSLGTTASGTTVNPGGTIDFGGLSTTANTINLGAEVVTISGTGIANNGALVNNNTNAAITQINVLQRLVLANHASIGGLTRWDVRGSGNTLNLAGYTLTKTGTNTVSLVGTAVTNAGAIDVVQGTFSVQTTTTMGGSAANTVTVRTNATLDLYQSGTWTAPTWSLVMDDGASLSCSSGTAVWNGTVALNGLVTNSGGNLTLSNDVSGASGAIAKVGTGTLTLSGNNTYGGGTTITNGIVVANTSMALGGGAVTLNPNATRLVLADYITLANNLTLNGGGASGRGLIENSGAGTAYLSGGTITINNAAVAGGGHFASVSSTTGGTLDVQATINSTTNVSFRTGTGVFSGGGSYPGFQITGTVRLGANDGLSTSASVDLCSANAAGTLDLNGKSQTLVGITRVNNYVGTIMNNSGGGNSLLTLTGASIYPGIITDGAYDGALIALFVNGGNLTLSGANTYAGPTTNSVGGTLQIGAGGAAGQLGTGPVVNDGTLIFNRSDSATNANVISGSGVLVKDGAGALNLIGLNTYTGPTVVSNGTLNVRTDATGSGSYAVRAASTLGVTLVAAGASLPISSLELGNFSRLAFDLTAAPGDVATAVVTDSGNLTMNGVVAVDVAGSGFSSAGTSVLFSYAGTRSGSGTFVGGTLPTLPGYTARIVDDVANKQVLLVFTLPSNELQWIGNVNPNWNSTDRNWVLFGTATPTNFSIYDSTRFDDAAAGLGTVSVNLPAAVVPGSVTVSNDNRDYVLSGSAISLGASLLKQGAAKLTLANNNTYVGATTISNGIVQVGSGGATGSLGAGPVINEATLAYHRSDSITNTVAISGAGSVIQAGSGTLTLAVANTYAGGTSISNGTVNAVAADALSTGGVTVGDNGTLNVTASQAANGLTINGNGTVNTSVTNGLGTAAVTIDGNGTLNLNAVFAGDVDYTGLATSMGGSGTVNVTLGTNTQTVKLNGYNGLFTGTVNVGTNAVAGAGKIQMNSPLDSTATLNLLSNATLYSNGAVDNPARLFLYGGDTGEALGQLRLDSGASWSGPVTLAGDITSTNDGTVGANSGTGTITGNIGETGGARALIKVGAGTIVLSGNNAYTGGTTNKGGILTANNNAAFGTGPVTVTNATRLVINDGITITNDVILSGGGGVAGFGMIQNSGAGNATLSGGTITVSGGVAAGGHFASATGGTLTIQDPINSTVALNSRAGTVIFGGGGSYSNLLVGQDTARLGANNGLSTSASVDVAASATGFLDLAGYDQSLAGITRNSATTATITNSSTTRNSLLTLTGTSSYPGLIKDAGVDGSRIALAVNGGNLSLGGANTYSSGTLVTNGGVLTATVAGALGTAAATNHGTLNLNGGAVTYTGLSVGMSGTGVVNVALGTGTGTTPLNGNNSGFTGILNIGTNGVTGATAAAGAGKVQMNGALGAGAGVNVLSNATLYVSAVVTQSVPVTLYGGDTGEDYGQLRLEANSTWAGPVTLAGDITTANDGFLGSNGGTDNRISGNISETGGARAVTKLRSGTIALSGNNSYSGLTTVSGGALRVESPTALGTTAAGTVVASGASLQIQGGIAVSGEALTLTGEGGGAGALRSLTNDNTWAANVTVNPSALTRIASDTNLLTINGNLALSTNATDQLVLQGGGDIAVNGAISGVSGVTSSSTGAGVRTLAGANTYTGPTLLNGGTLRVTGSLANTTVTNLGGILTGNGILAGPVLVSTNGTLAPGVSPALNEVLTLNNTLGLDGTALFQIGKSGATPINDRVAGLTDVTYGGTLVATNVDGSPLAAGDVFTLFSAAGVTSGNFSKILVQPASLGLTGVFDPVTGKLTLVERKLSYTLVGSSLEFSWLGGGKLQAQTNSLSLGVSTNWADYPGGATSPVTVVPDPAQPTVFFRVLQ